MLLYQQRTIWLHKVLSFSSVSCEIERPSFTAVLMSAPVRVSGCRRPRTRTTALVIPMSSSMVPTLAIFAVRPIPATVTYYPKTTPCIPKPGVDLIKIVSNLNKTKYIQYQSRAIVLFCSTLRCSLYMLTCSSDTVSQWVIIVDKTLLFRDNQSI